jgi:hypothetical protein
MAIATFILAVFAIGVFAGAAFSTTADLKINTGCAGYSLTIGATDWTPAYTGADVLLWGDATGATDTTAVLRGHITPTGPPLELGFHRGAGRYKGGVIVDFGDHKSNRSYEVIVPECAGPPSSTTSTTGAATTTTTELSCATANPAAPPVNCPPVGATTTTSTTIVLGPPLIIDNPPLTTPPQTPPARVSGRFIPADTVEMAATPQAAADTLPSTGGSWGLAAAVLLVLAARVGRFRTR